MAKQFPYDAACKALFGEEIIFRNLLANYGILSDRDVGAITAVRLLSPNLETEKASRRMADLIWAVTFPQGELHVLLEFQRGRDETMANRMAVYAHLHMAKLLTQKKPPGQLPAILPIVIYLGEKPWNCARHSHELYAPAPVPLPVAPYGGSYYLLDVHWMSTGWNRRFWKRPAPQPFSFSWNMSKAIRKPMTRRKSCCAAARAPNTPACGVLS